MGHLWHSGPEGAFARSDLPRDGLSLRRGRDGLDLVVGAVADALARVLPLERRAVLLAGAGARIVVNGGAVLGVRVLEERDELLVEGERLFFGSASETAPRRFASEDGAQRCGRCHRVLHPGDEVVACGNCSSLHHEGHPAGEKEALLCWSHATVCGRCQHERTAWTPEAAADA